MNTWGREAFACHPHHLYGPMAAAACGENGPGTSYPTGGANTADGWPPIAYTVIANLSRPFFLFTDDALFAVRFGVVSLWTLGMLVLVGLASRRGISKLQSLTAATAITVLPGIGYFSSFVSPYAALPILTAYAIWTYDWLLARLKNRFSLDRRTIVEGLAAAAFPAITILTVPHSISVVIAVSIGIGLTALRHLFRKGSLRPSPRSVLIGLSAALLTPLAYFVHRFYNAIRAWRTIEYPSDASPDVSDAVTSSHNSDWFAEAQARAWNFFPRAIDSALPVPDLYRFVATLLTFVVVGVVIARALRLLDSHDYGLLEIGIVIASPIGALIYYYSLSFEAPPRYGLPLALLGFSVLIVRKLPPRAIGVVVALATLLFVFAVRSDPIYIEQPCWEVGANGYLQLCESS